MTNEEQYIGDGVVDRETGQGSRPVIVCLCGSTRFYKEFQRANYEETMAGRIVLSVGFYMHASEDAHGERWGCTPEQKITLDELHFRKIELADEVLVINVGGYVGESTRNEIDHARSLGKPIRWLEPAQSLCRCGDQWCPACTGTLDEYRRAQGY
jgi:hypothetical protein